MAIDLRETISSLKISQDLERIGDLSKSNAKKVKPLPLDLPEELLGNLKRLGELVIKQLNDVLDSYVNKNYDKAKIKCVEKSKFFLSLERKSITLSIAI